MAKNAFSLTVMRVGPFQVAEMGQKYVGLDKRRTADLMLTLLYSLTVDVMERYDVSFDWLRYRGVPNYPTDPLYSTKRSARSNASGFRRTHSIRWTPRKIMGLPDDQFIQLLQAAWN